MDPCYAGGDTATIQCLEVYVQRLINFLYPIAGAVALLFLLWGGIKFIRSGGEPKSVEEAKKTMTWALLGLALIFLLWAILAVIAEITGVNLREYNIVVP